MTCSGLVRGIRPDGDLAVQVHGHRAVELVAPGQAGERRLEEAGVLGVQPQPGQRPRAAAGITRSTSGNRTSFWISQADRPGADAEERRGVSVRPTSTGWSRGRARQAKIGEPLISRSPVHGKRKPERTSSCRPSVATIWSRVPWSWTQSRA